MNTRKSGAEPARPQSVRETLRRQIGDASRTLRKPGLDDEDVHRARKGLKRARANLRLLRDAIGRPAYARANAALRDAARPWSRVRDAKVMVDTLDELLGLERNASRRALLAKLRRDMEDTRLGMRHELEASGEAASTVSALDDAWREADRLRFSGKSSVRLHKGIDRIYRRAKKAHAAARKDNSPEKLHEWRKEVKYLAQAMESFSAVDAAPKLRARAEDVAETLGKDHDLVILQQEIARLHSDSHARAGLFTEIAERRQRLQSKALKRAKGLLKRKPKAFVRKLRKG